MGKYEELDRLMEEDEKRQAIEDPIKDGYTRIYTDHTGRWYEDYSPEEIEAMNNDPLLRTFFEEVQKEINKMIIDSLCKGI